MPSILNFQHSGKDVYIFVDTYLPNARRLEFSINRNYAETVRNNNDVIKDYVDEINLSGSSSPRSQVNFATKNFILNRKNYKYERE